MTDITEIRKLIALRSKEPINKLLSYFILAKLNEGCSKYNVFLDKTHKDIFEDIYNDYNEVDLRQTNNGDHYMSVILRGTEPTDISVIQNGWNNKSYSVTNYCYTTSGCAISVTQGN